MQDTSFKAGLVWTPHYWRYWTYKAVILEQYADNLRMRTDKETVFDVPLSEVHAEFTRWGRLFLTVNGQKYIIVGNTENATFSKEQNEELKQHNNNAYLNGSVTAVGAGAASTAAVVGSAVAQTAGAATAVAGAVGSASAQYDAQGRIEEWHAILERKKVPLKYTPANGYTYFIIFVVVALIVGLFIAIKFFKH